MLILKVLGAVFGSKQDRDMRKLRPNVEKVNSFGPAIRALTDEQLKAKTAEFRDRLSKGQTLDDILPEAFAVCREATHRVLGERRTVFDPYFKKDIPFMAHFDVQIMGAAVLHQGKIAEMKTGEGKTQVSVLAAYLNALTGKGVHVVTVNDYLARRDSEWMGRIHTFLGLTVGCLDTTEPGTPERRQAYECDITYGTNNEYGFDYLRDNMASSPSQLVQRELNFAIIDEVDNILIDEARTPLIISGPVTKSNREYEELKPRVERLVSAQSQEVQKVLDEIEPLVGKEGKEYELGYKLLVVKRGAPKNKKLNKLLKEEGVSKYMKQVETDYLREKKLYEIDEELFYTIDESGHSAEMTEKGRALVSQSNPDFFIVPDLSELLHKIDTDPALTPLEKSEKRDETHRMHSARSERIHCVSQLLRAYSLFELDVDYVVQDGQILIVDEFTGRILHGRRWSEGLHQAVEAKEGVKIAGENQTLATITFQNFFKMYAKISGMTGTAITEAGEFNEIYKLDVVTVPTHRPMKRDDFEDEIYRTHREKYNAVVKEITEMNKIGRPVLVGTTSIEKSELLSKLLLRAGIMHEVLNAKQHAREAQIVAQAGRLGGVTIATNMAGRGTDIVLGGNFEANANNELFKEGIALDDLSLEEKRQRYAKLYKQLEEEHAKVVELGGLHIVGTERHEARRIDNQLRGRSGRQGDPGSSKFFLSLDDDLMRIFGSERIASIMDRLGAQEGEVISHPFVTRAIGNAQKRVEARNFEIRKHLKDYDDVMNLQRKEIYGLRQRILKGEDIKDEVLDQLAGSLEELIYKYTSEGRFSDQWNLKDLFREVETLLGVVYALPDEARAQASQDSLFDEMWKLVKARYEEKEARLTAPIMRQFERGVCLMVIDNLWKDHLYEMDHLKGGVQYRAYGQKNPLYEYQREGMKMFEELRSSIARDVTSFLFRLEAVTAEEDRMGLNRSQTMHGAFDIFSSPGEAQAEPEPQLQARQQFAEGRGGGPQPEGPVRRAPVVRTMPAVGRNDPCPCGSGKKYK
ncbi:MAG TPA: preprotein translocase subunit SecA, partial [Chitinivibrionales bacterium]|nr:preprotein translocase subunit SecA [Chitinivibrionales bacterium]